jgi:hypothetical protein
MAGLDIESWAFARAHNIVLHQGLSLAKAAQDLDHTRSKRVVEELRTVITEAIVEAYSFSRPSQSDAAFDKVSPQFQRV